MLGDDLNILFLVAGRRVADQLPDPEIEVEIVPGAESQFRQDGNPGLEMEQGGGHMNPGGMAEEGAFDAFAAGGVLIDEHGDVLALVDGSQYRADSLRLVHEFVHFSRAVRKDHSADERIAEGAHHREHGTACFFGERFAGDLPVAEVSGNDDDLMIFMIGREGVVQGFRIAGDGYFFRRIELVHLDDFDEKFAEFPD